MLIDANNILSLDCCDFHELNLLIMQKQDLKPKTIRLNPSLLVKIEELSRIENRNFNNMVETLLLRATGSLK